ncbi:hypothetical protein JZO84_11170, partial [Enterococcus plantarum]|nr:hypothetical protein [Enterococcus plantarum]
MLGGGHLNQVVDLLVEVAQVFRAETIHLVSPALYSSQTDLISAEHKDRIKNVTHIKSCIKNAIRIL